MIALECQLETRLRTPNSSLFIIARDLQFTYQVNLLLIILSISVALI